MNALRSREECEINNGGFGLGELQELYVDLKGDESDVDEKCNEKEPNMENLSDDFFQLDNLMDIVRMIMFFIMFRDKKIFERALCEAYSLYPKNKEVKEFVEKCKSIYKEIIDVEKDVADTEKDVATDTEKDIEKDVADYEKDVADTIWTQFFSNNLEEIIIYENAKKSLFRTYKDEQEEAENNFMNDIFGICYGLESKKFLLASLNPGVELYGNVIDCWAAVLNYEEKFRNPESLNRLSVTHQQFLNGRLPKMKNKANEYNFSILHLKRSVHEQLIPESHS
ncbi:hypothetical protein L1987_54922 [Smallanthus sonchifolius]|uniref:Uncharacterized protein n=1 Tax=Smallanthus sonchifolius TaxID=185202 RepID=A0ACB9E9I9_9ASTR|nr:hypothetical protein L1987_54922 [Smallanthus sonchifolius]